MNYLNFNDYLKKTLNAKPIGTEIYKKQIDIENPKDPIHELPTELITKSIVADSRDRDRVVYPNSNRFQVKGETNSQSSNARLGFNIKNVQQIKLEECIVPNFTSFHPYLLMTIPELQDVIHGTNNTLRNAFAILIPERQFGINFTVTVDTTTVDAPAWVNCKTPKLYCVKVFDPPLAKLHNLTIEYRTPDGELFDFSQAIPDNNNVPEPKNETLAVFNVCSEIPSKNILNYHLVT